MNNREAERMVLDKKAVEVARKKILFALVVGLIVPILTVISMYCGYSFGKGLGEPFDALLALLGAFGGFAVAAAIAWRIIMRM
jgi:hypothetical protein